MFIATVVIEPFQNNISRLHPYEYQSLENVIAMNIIRTEDKKVRSWNNF